MAALFSWYINVISIYGYKLEFGSLITWIDQNIMWLVLQYRWYVIVFRLFNVIPDLQPSDGTDVTPNVAYKTPYQMHTGVVSPFSLWLYIRS